VFSYSFDGINWQYIGSELNMRWTMTHFTGARFGLFYYAAKTAGGHVDFDYFRVSAK
jgi:beta-xylosidase